VFAATPAASRLGLSARAQPAKELIPALRPKWNRHNFFLHRSPSSTLLSSLLVHLSANKHKSLSTTRPPLARTTPHPPHCRTQQTPFPFPQPLSCSADPTSPPPSEFGQSTSTAPSCPGSPLPQLHQQSHQQVNRYICVICISHPTQTTSDTSRLSSCNHFAYRGNLVAHTSVATANTPPPRRMLR
jgi:hypothetical protein